MDRDADPSAFDAVAADYDAVFTHSVPGQLLRQRVWRTLSIYYRAGHRVLELACGTGEDAVWLAQRGVAVTATDASSEMVRATLEKAQRAGVAELVTPQRLSMQDIAKEQVPVTPGVRGTTPSLFDGAFSNFGGLNTLDEWRFLAAALARLVRPGGHLVLVPMGPVCPWEIGWHLLHGEWATAVRRFHAPATARVGNRLIPVWYPSARRLRRDFTPWFDTIRVGSLGLWLPPTYLASAMHRSPHLLGALHRLECRVSGLTGDWGDHYVMVLRRVPS